MTDFHPAYPPYWVRQQFVVANMQAATLHAAIAPHANRHGDRPAPAQVLADTAELLVKTRRLVSHLPGWRSLLELEGEASWAALSVKLALAARALRCFEQRFIDEPDWFDEEDDEDEDEENE